MDLEADHLCRAWLPPTGLGLTRLVRPPLAVAGGARRLLARLGHTVRQRRDVLVPRDDPLDRLGVLLPELEVGPELKLVGGGLRDVLDLVQVRDDALEAVGGDLPRYEIVRVR